MPIHAPKLQNVGGDLNAMGNKEFGVNFPFPQLESIGGSMIIGCLELAGRIQRELKTPIDNSASFKKTTLYQCTIEKLLAKPYMKPKQVYRILQRDYDYDYDLSYCSFNRYTQARAE
jgi:hypothetical protein